MLYTNAQFRSILNGLGFRSRGTNELDFPLSEDETSLTDDVTVQAIEQFQAYFHLVVDGIAGPQTMATAKQEMIVLHIELNQILGTEIPDNQPFYGLITIETIQQFEARHNFPIDGIASLPVRQNLYLLTHPNATPKQFERKDSGVGIGDERRQVQFKG